MTISTSSQNQDDDDRQFDTLTAGDGRLLDDEPIDGVERLEFFSDIGLPALQAEAISHERELPLDALLMNAPSRDPGSPPSVSSASIATAGAT